MTSNKWTRTATSASLTILGVTQFVKKAGVMVQLSETTPFNSSGCQIWSLDRLMDFSHMRGLLSLNEEGKRYWQMIFFCVRNRQPFSFKSEVCGQGVGEVNAQMLGVRTLEPFDRVIKITESINNRWDKCTTNGAQTVSIIQDYFQSTARDGIKVGDTDADSGSTSVTYYIPSIVRLDGASVSGINFSPLEDATVSVKSKETIHPLTLLAMGAAGVIKWRTDRDKNAA